MPEQVNQKTAFSLLEVTKSIQKTLTERYQQIFWVKAEMNKLNHYPHSGHCYPELVQKAGGKVISEMKGVIWREDFIRINALFLRTLNEPVRNGITILFAARITFDPMYGLSLRILDIDPSFSLGEMEIEKQRTILRMQEEGIFDVNRSRELPMLPKRIAVISVQTSKGYADFLNILEGNPYGYRIFTMLFPAVLQGEKAVESIIFQLGRIEGIKHHFDAIAIIRGGGGDVGLNCYNQYELASLVARSPLPVITGIGHSTNETITEMVAFKNAITPTELADFLIQQFHNFAVPVERARERISEKARGILREENSGLRHTVKIFRMVTEASFSGNINILENALKTISNHSVILINKEKTNLERSGDTLKNELIQSFHNEKMKTDHLAEKINILDPVNTLKRGYSITRLKGKSIISLKEIEPGTTVETQVTDGTFISNVISKNSKDGGTD